MAGSVVIRVTRHESVEQPLDYYGNNLGSTLSLLAAMSRHGVRTIVFSSSATVYGAEAPVPMKEDFPTSATNPARDTWMSARICFCVERYVSSMSCELTRPSDPSRFWIVITWICRSPRAKGPAALARTSRRDNQAAGRSDNFPSNPGRLV